MPDELPAAVPLVALIAGVACGAALVNPLVAIAALVVCSLLSRRSLFLFAALGICLALHQVRIREAERSAFASLDHAEFVAIDAPLDRDWSDRDGSYTLRVRRFEANGRAFGRPLSMHARFEPPAIAMRTSIHAEGFLRQNERGDYALTIKSPRLMHYSGTLSRLDPERWNRAAAMRIAPYSDRYPTEVALTCALALGRGERLSQSSRDAFRRGGTYHLLVFSGMQIAIAAAAIALLLRWLHAPRACDALLLAFAIIAPLFIGAEASVSRASIAIGLYALSRILRRPTSIPNLWCVAALIRLIAVPGDLTDAAFQLTYAGAGALIFIAKPFATNRARWMVYAAAAELAITPLTLFHFHQFALGGSLATLLLTPLISLMLMLGAAVCVVPGGRLFAAIGVLNALCDAVNDVSASCSGIFNAPPLASLVIGSGVSLLALAAARGRTRALLIAAGLAIPTIAALCLRFPSSPRLIAFDVGQGDAIAITSGDHAILIDGGPSDARLLPQLADHGIRHLDAVFLTHAHPDHCGGLPSLLDRMRVDSLWISPRRFTGDCAQRLLPASTPIHLVRDRDSANFGGIRIEAHAVPHTFRRSPENNSSVVLRVQVERRRLLLTGDIEKEAERWLIERALRAEIMKVAHHGSRSSTTPEFLDTVQPRVAIISCGRENLFGHPHRETLETLESRKIRIRRTDLDGSIEIPMTGSARSPEN